MTQSMTTARDIPILVTSTDSSSERRITPSWTIAHLKSKLEPVTGIAPSSQRLTLRLPDREQETPIETDDDEDMVEIGRWPLVAYAELKVSISLTYSFSLSFFLSFFLLFSFFTLLIKDDHLLHRKPKPININRNVQKSFKFGVPKIEQYRLRCAYYISPLSLPLSLHVWIQPDSIFRVASLPSCVHIFECLQSNIS